MDSIKKIFWNRPVEANDIIYETMQQDVENPNKRFLLYVPLLNIQGYLQGFGISSNDLLLQNIPTSLKKQAGKLDIVSVHSISHI